MTIENFLTSYNLVSDPVFETPTLDIPTFNSYDRLNEFVLNTLSKKETTEEPFDWNMNLRGVEKKDSESSAKPVKSDSTSVEGRVVSRLKQHGFNDMEIRAIKGNLKQESGFKENIISKDGHNSYGLALWTGPRKLRLFSAKGLNPSIEDQVDFLVEELNSTHKSALAALKKSKSVEEATKAFMDTYERPHKDYAALDKRIKYALA